MKSRRKVLASAVVLLAGCTGLRSSNDDKTTETTESEDTTGTAAPTDYQESYSLTDLRIANKRDETVVVTVTLVPDGETEPTMELSVQLLSEDVIKWEDNPLLDDPGHLTVTVDDGSGEPERTETHWRGDTEEDNRGISVYVEEDEIEVYQPVA